MILHRFPTIAVPVHIFLFALGAIVTAIESVSITSLEKRFQLSSVQIGWIASAVHISAATVGTLASFYATRYAFEKVQIGLFCLLLHTDGTESE